MIKLCDVFGSQQKALRERMKILYGCVCNISSKGQSVVKFRGGARNSCISLD